jgi:parallel beta-helix repeat protein
MSRKNASGRREQVRCQVNGLTAPQATTASRAKLIRATDRMFEQLETRRLLTSYYVDDNWVEQVNSAPGGTPGVVEPGDIVKTAPGDSPSISNLVFDTQAFATVQTAADKFFVTGADTIKVISGIYPQALNLTDSPGAHAASLSGLTIEGAQAGVDARSRSGQPESIITTSATNTNGQLWYIDPSVSNVTIDGFTFDGNGPATGGVTLLDGVTDSNAARGIVVDGNGVDIKNNIITNYFRRGIQYGRFGTPTGGTVSQNSFDNIGADDELPDFSNSGYAMLAFADPSFIDNNVTNTHNGAYYIQVYPPATAPITVKDNTISARESGITLNEISAAAPVTTIQTNHVTVTDANGVGVVLWTVGNPLSFTNNTLGSTAADTTGVEVWAGAAGVPVNVTLSGGSISGFATGVHVTNSANVNGAQTPALDSARANLNNVSITMPAGGTGVFVEDTANSNTAVSASFGSGTTINGSSSGAGVSLSGANATLVGDTLASVAFAGFTGTGQFVVLGDGAYSGNELDGTGATYNGVAGGATLTVLDGWAIEDRIKHRLDASATGTGLVRIRSGNIYVTTDSGSIQRGIDAASPGDDVNVQDGTYSLTTAVQVNKQVRLLGRQAGVDARTRSGPETIVDGSGVAGFPVTDFNVTVSGATIDGFTITGISGGQAQAGITLASGTHGSKIRNNILQGNNVGLFLANNSSSSATTVTQNLFQDNTAAGSASGHGIYADNFTAGNGMQNVAIQDNKFTNSAPTTQSYAVGLANTNASIAFTNITISGNDVSNSGRGMYSYGTSGSTISGNTITGATRYAVGIFGSTGTVANSNLSFTGNTFNNNGVGIWVDDDAPGTAYSGTLTLSGNNYNTSGSQKSIIDTSTTAIDATGETFNGVLASSASDSQQYAIVDTIVDGVDLPNRGLVRTRANTVFVTPNSFYQDPTYAPSGTTSPDIQRAIDLADSGDTVNIQGGTYPSTLTINKTITLDGEGSNATPLVTLNAKTSSPIIKVTSTNGTDNVTIRDIAFDGLNGSNHAGEGIRTDGPASFGTLTVQRSTFTNLNFDAIAINGDGTNGISARNLVFSDDSFSANGSAGGGGTGDISIFQYNGDATFTNLTLVGNAGANTGEQVAIQFRGVGSGSGIGVLPMGNIALNNIDISGSYVRSMLGFQRYSTLTGLNMTDVKLGGATSNITGTFGDLLRFDAAGSGSVSSPATVDLGSTHFRGVSPTSPLQSYLEFAPDNSFAFLHADATNTVWDLPTGGSNLTASSMTTAQAFEAEDRILDYEKNLTGGATFKGWAELQNGKAFVTPTAVGPINGDLITRAGQIVDSGGTVYIKSGSYTENVSTSSNSVHLAPDSGTGQVTLNGNLTLDSNDALAILVNGLTAGTNHGQFIVNGTVSLNGASLDTAGSTINATQGQSLTIVANDASDPVNGFFAAPANGNGYVININGQPFFVFYNGGDGNDVKLTRAPDGTQEGQPTAPSVVFVDDNWTANPNGTDTDGPTGGSLGNGTAKGYDEFDNITAALAAVAPGGTIFIYSGNYAESVTVNKAVTFDGEGSGPTPLVNWISSGSSPLVRITSTNASDDVTIRDIAFDGLNGSNQSGEGIRTDAPANFDTLTVQRSTFTHFNFDAVAINGDGVNGVSARNLVFSDDSFSANGSAGGGGTGDISVFQYNGDATFTNLTLVGNAGANTGEQVGVQFRGVGSGSGSGVLPMGNIALNNIDISGNYVRSMIGIQRYTTANTLSMTGVKLGGATSKITGTFGASLRFDAVGTGTLASPATVNLGNTLFRGLSGSSAQRHEIEFAPDNNFAFLRANATNTTWTIGGTDVPAGSLTLAQAYAVERRILHYVDKLAGGTTPYKGFAEVQAGKAFVTDDPESGLIGEGSIQRASEVVPVNGTVNVEAGTYNQLATITKTGVKILGAQAGVDARTRSAVPESILASNAGSLDVEANNVVIDGFTIRDTNSGQNAGLSLSPVFSGYQVLNNIITNNVFGLYLNSGGATQTLVRHNLFDSNNQAGSSSGDGIYADAGSKNVLVDANKFTGHSSAAMVFAGTAGNQDITVNGNQMVNDNSIVFFNSTNVDITNNTSTGSQGSVIFIGGGNSDVLISGNNASGAPTVTGVRLPNPGDFGSTANSNVRAIGNTFSGLLNGIRASTGSTSDQLLVQGNTLTGNTNGIRLDGGNAAITANNNIGNNTGAGVLVESGGTATISGNTSPGIHDNFVGVDVNGGTATLTSNTLNNNTTAVSVHGGGNVTLTSDTFNGNSIGLLAQGGTATITNSHHIDGIGIGNGGLVTVVANGNTLLVTTSLTVNGTGKLDLNDNDMIVNYSGASQLAAIQALINAGRAGGAWTGNGITSTAARNNAQHNTTLGAMEATDYQSIYGPGATFDGEALDSTAVLVKYTYYGDTDFNGTVNFDDYVRTDNGFNNHLSGWKNGDFNGDGQVNFDDYVLIDLAFNTQSGTLSRGGSGAGTGTSTGAGNKVDGASSIVDGTAPRRGATTGSGKRA